MGCSSRAVLQNGRFHNILRYWFHWQSAEYNLIQQLFFRQVKRILFKHKVSNFHFISKNNVKFNARKYCNFNLIKMEILFIYIDNYKVLKEANINFGGKYLFKFSKETSKLTYESNKYHIDGFYDLGNKGIKNYSYLVGNNGAGKSTTLEFIKENFVLGTNLKNECIVIYEKNNEYHIISTFDIKTDFPFKTSPKIVKPQSQLKAGFDFGYPQRGLEDLHIVFFSNLFDGKIEGRDLKGIKNISTNSLIINDYNFYLEQNLIEKETNPMIIHLSQEVYRQFNF